MKILFVSLNHAPEQTSIGKYQGEMAAWFAARGHQVSVLAAPPYYPQWKIAAGYSAWRYRCEQRDGVEVCRIPLYVPAVPSGAKRLVHLASFCLALFPALIVRALRDRPDVIALTAPPLMAVPFVWLAARLCGARCHLHVQDFEVDAAFRLGLLRAPALYKAALAMERLALRAFDTLSTISPNMLKALVAKGAAPERAHLIANWANVEAFDNAPAPQETGKTCVLYAGNLGRKQGLEVIVEAAQLLQNHGEISFVVCGDGAGRAEMQAQASGLANVSFRPVLDEEAFRKVMLTADIHLLPQRKEAADLVMPSKLGNILASGRPVIVGACAGTQLYEAVQGCGLAVEPEDAQALAGAILTLAGDGALRAAYGQTARARAQQDWGRDAALGRLERLLGGT